MPLLIARCRSVASSDGRSAYDVGFGVITVADVDGDAVTIRPIVEALWAATRRRPGGWVPGTRLVAVLAHR